MSSDEDISSSSDSESLCGSTDHEREPGTVDFVTYDESLEPVATEEESSQYEKQLAIEEEEQQTLSRRFTGEVDVTDWCKCSNCSHDRITKAEECFCCMDIDTCEEKMVDVDKEGDCITEHPGFEVCCLNPWSLKTAAIGLKTKDRRSYSTTKTQKKAAEPEFLRSVAYRQYVRLVYEYVGSSRRVPLPNCVYNSIRRAFPNVDGEYTGYQEEEELEEEA